LRNLRLVGQTDLARLETAFVGEVLDEARDIVGPRLRRADLRVAISPEDLAIGGEQARYARVVANLLSWLRDGTPAGGRLSVEASERGEEVVVQVRGEGANLHAQAPALADELFGAHGLGLSVACTIVRAAGGR